VADRQDAHQIIIFGLAKSIFDHIPVEAGLDDFVGGPLALVGYKNIFAELFNVETYSVVIFTGQKPPIFLYFSRETS
jgi:hypothetical protein